MTAVHRATTIGRVELRRRWRSLQANTGQLIAIAFVALFGSLFVGAGLLGVYFLGTGIRAGETDSPIRTVRYGLVYLWIFVIAFGGYRAYATALRPDRLDGMLTTVSHRELLGGLLLAEAILWGVPGAAFVGLCALVFAAGTGSVLAAPIAFVTVGLVTATALAGGFLLALVVRNAGVRSRLLTRLRTVFVVLLGLAYFWLVFTQSFGTVLAPAYELLAPTPVGWFADLLLVGTVGEASVARAGGAALASGLFLLASAGVLSRLAAGIWYADGVHVERGRTDAASSKRSTRLEAIVSRPVAGVVLRDWKRARRAPITLSFVVYPLFVLIDPVASTVRSGTVGSAFPILVALSGAWVAGALFSLNVLGNEGAVLPSTLLAARPGRTLVVGHAVAGALVGAPATVVATVALGVASPHSIAAVGTLAVSALLLAVCAGPIASGIGAVFPRFDEVRVSRSSRAIVPSMLAFAVFSIVVVLVALPTLAGHSAIVGHAVASWLGVPPASIRVGGTALSAVLGIGTGLVSARYAVRTVDTFRLD